MFDSFFQDTCDVTAEKRAEIIDATAFKLLDRAGYIDEKHDYRKNPEEYLKWLRSMGMELHINIKKLESQDVVEVKLMKTMLTAQAWLPLLVIKKK